MRNSEAGLGRKARAFFVTALLLPYLVLQSVAAGVMPQSVDGKLSFSLCLGDRVVLARLQDDGTYRPDASGADTAHEDRCPWAVMHALAAMPDTSPASHSAVLARPLDAAAYAAPVPVAADARLPLARAPPRYV